MHSESCGNTAGFKQEPNTRHSSLLGLPVHRKRASKMRSVLQKNTDPVSHHSMGCLCLAWPSQQLGKLSSFSATQAGRNQGISSVYSYILLISPVAKDSPDSPPSTRAPRWSKARMMDMALTLLPCPGEASLSPAAAARRPSRAWLQWDLSHRAFPRPLG